MSSSFAALFVVWSAVAAATDWRERRVTNTWLAVGLLAALLSYIIGDSARIFLLTPDRANRLFAALIGLGIMLPAFCYRAVGASDVKFLSILGLWTDSHTVIWTWIFASILALIHAVSLYRARRNLHVPTPVGSEFSGVTSYRRCGIPFVTYLALGVAAVMTLGILAPGSLEGNL